MALVGGRYLVAPLGLADNGDFWRVMAPAGIEYRSPPPVRYREFAVKLNLGPSAPAFATTSAALPAWLAAGTAKLFSREFDLRFLGALYFAVFLAGLALLFRNCGSWIFWIGFSWLALDPAYFLHFNSFFSQAFALALLPWLLWAFSGYAATGRGVYAVILAGAVLLTATSKLQFALLPLLALTALLPIRRNRFIVNLLAGTAVLTLLFSFLPGGSPRLGLLVMNRYHAVFTGIAPLANDPPALLRSLDIPESYHYLTGHGMYELSGLDKITPELSRSLARISLAQLAAATLAHPEIIWHSIPKFQQALAVTRIDYLGNYPQPAQEKNFSPIWRWANARDLLYLIPVLPWLLVLGALAYLGFSWRRSRRLQPWECLALFLALDFLTQLPVTMLGNGYYAFGRLLISARFELDLLLLIFLDQLAQKRSADSV